MYVQVSRRLPHQSSALCIVAILARDVAGMSGALLPYADGNADRAYQEKWNLPPGPAGLQAAQQYKQVLLTDGHYATAVMFQFVWNAVPGILLATSTPSSVRMQLDNARQAASGQAIRHPYWLDYGV